MASVVILIYVILLKIKYGKGAKSGHAIIPEYTPPQGVNVVTAAVIMNNNLTWVAAEYIDLAIKNIIKLVEFKKACSIKRHTRPS